MATKKPKVHLKVLVSLADIEFIPGNEGHCPIARAMKLTDPDILVPRATDKRITFSRRSTGLRYVYQTPLGAVRFIHAVDAIVETKKIPDDYQLILTEHDLISARPRLRGNNHDTFRNAHHNAAAVKIEDGKVVVEAKLKSNPVRHRPKRFNTVA